MDIKTGLISLDMRLNGGIKRGSITEISGPPGGGKTALCRQIIESARSQGLVTAFFDMEYTYDPACKTGKPHMYSTPKNITEFAGACIDLCETGAVDLIVMDTAAAAAPGENANNYDRYFSRIVQALSASDTSLVYTNQRRRVYSGFGIGKSSTPGGRLLKLYTNIRIMLGRGYIVQEGAEHRAMMVFLKVLKSEGIPPFIRTKCNIYQGEFNPVEDLVKVALEVGRLERSGNWIKLDGVVLGNGIYAATKSLIARKLWKSLGAEVYSLLGLH